MCRGCLLSLLVLILQSTRTVELATSETSSMTATCPASAKVTPNIGLNFLHANFLLPRCVCVRSAARKRTLEFAISASSGEDRPAQVSEVRDAARNMLKVFLDRAIDTASTNAASRTARKSSDTILNPDAILIPQKIRIGFIGTGTITSAVVKGLCSAEDACDLQILVSPRNKEKAAILREMFPQQVDILIRFSSRFSLFICKHRENSQSRSALHLNHFTAMSPS